MLRALGGIAGVVLRKNSPKVRYWVWLSASLKFLIPFALLVSLGSVIPRPVPHSVSLRRLFSQTPSCKSRNRFRRPSRPPFQRMPTRLGAGRDRRRVGPRVLAIAQARCRTWWGVRAALRAGTPIELPIPIRALLTLGAEEPGIVGFLRPVMVLPAQLLEHLNPRNWRDSHARAVPRAPRDNLFAALHMVVEAIFWFHPLVWWIGSRMVEERELACDEEVLRTGCEPADYVEGS